VVHSLRTEVALFYDSEIFAKKPRIIGAGDDAVTASDTIGRIYNDDSIRALHGSAGGAYTYTGRFRAMVTLLGFVGRCQFWPFAFVLFVHPISILAQRNLVFSAAGNRTRPAIDALPGIDNESIAFSVCGHILNPSEFNERFMKRGISRNFVPSRFEYLRVRSSCFIRQPLPLGTLAISMHHVDAVGTNFL
jgi:hypothetical protein